MTQNSDSRRRMREGARKGGIKRGRERRRAKAAALLGEREGATPDRVAQIDSEVAALRERVAELRGDDDG